MGLKLKVVAIEPLYYHKPPTTQVSIVIDDGDTRVAELRMVLPGQFTERETLERRWQVRAKELLPLFAKADMESMFASYWKMIDEWGHKGAKHAASKPQPPARKTLAWD